MNISIETPKITEVFLPQVKIEQEELLDDDQSWEEYENSGDPSNSMNYEYDSVSASQVFYSNLRRKMGGVGV